MSKNNVNPQSSGYNPFANSSTEFTITSDGFVPGNAITKEEFPDLDQAFGAP